jgi:hypothetical protein
MRSTRPAPIRGKQSAGCSKWSRARWPSNENLRLDPFYPALNLALKALTHIMVGEFETALALTRAGAERAKVFACSLYRALAANELDLNDEAHEAVATLLEINPQFGIARHMRMAPFSDQKSADGLAAYMRRAGIPE